MGSFFPALRYENTPIQASIRCYRGVETAQSPIHDVARTEARCQAHGRAANHDASRNGRTPTGGLSDLFDSTSLVPQRTMYAMLLQQLDRVP